MATAALTQADFLNQMITQARLLDPSASFNVGTPEWKILSSVAQALASNQVDMTGLANALNISSKVGNNLDQFVSNFGMQRQGPTPGQGYVVFSAPTAVLADVVIPQGTTIQANNVNTNAPSTVQYQTTATGTIPQGGTTSGLVPVQSITAGSASNVAAGALNQLVGNTLPAGVSAVTNPTAITNASDNESDSLLTARFQNTWARNLSGTTSSYLAVALAGAFSTKAVCIGQQSTYIEYIQVPDTDDTGELNGAIPSGSGIVPVTSTTAAGLWTTALSDIPYAKQIFNTLPTFISQNGTGTYYYQQGVDYTFNSPPLLQGDALREYVTTAPDGETVTIAGATAIPVENPVGFPDSGTLYIYDSTGNFSVVDYTGISPYPTGTNYPQYYEFTGVSAVSVNSGATTVVGNPIYLLPQASAVAQRPNFTFTNVSSIVDAATGLFSTQFDVTTNQWVTNSAAVNPTDTLVTVQALTPGQVVQSEFKYVSQASRNNLAANVNNAIDVYVNNSNPQQTSCVFLPPAANAIFSSSSSSPFYVENYRRDGDPTRRPNVNNYFTPLFNPPLLSLPASITGPDGSTFFLGVHYWLVHETDDLVNSIRARDGIEWSAQMWGDTQTTAPTANEGYVPEGNPATATLVNYSVHKLPVPVNNYSNDANIIGMQATFDTSTPATTDVLAHGAKSRYFKFDVTLMYSPNANPASVQSGIATSLSAYLNNQYFGTVVQLSNILDVISSVNGVQNVRWTNDLPTPPNQIRVIETDINGNPLAGVRVGRYAPYAINAASFTIQIAGANYGPEDYFTLTWTDTVIGATFTTAPILYVNALSSTSGASTIESAINAVMESYAWPYSTGVTVLSTPLYESIETNNPYVQYLVTYNAPTTTVATSSNGVNVSTFTGTGTLNIGNSTNFPTTGIVNVSTASGIAVVQYGSTATGQLLNCDTLSSGVTSGVLSTGGFVAPRTPVLATVTNSFTQGIYLYDQDFFLMDDELPSLPTGQVSGDTLPGLIARTRAENTFFRPGIG